MAAATRKAKALRQTDEASLRIFERNQCAAQNREEYVKIARIEAQ